MTWDAIVVGGGIVGLSTAWHLVQDGLKKVLLLERRSLASGASGLGAGSVHSQRWNPVDIALVARSRQIMNHIGERSCGVFRFHSVGRLTLASHELEGQLRAYGEMVRAAGVDLEYLQDRELTARFPGINTSDVGLGVYTPDDGYIYPPSLVWTLAGIARNDGVTIWEGAPVARILYEGRSLSGVLVGEPAEAIRSRTVIVSCGAWSENLLRASDLSLPLRALRAQAGFALITGPSEAKMPSVLDINQDFYSLPRNPGTLIAGGGVLGEAPLSDPQANLSPEPDPEFLHDLHAKLRYRFDGWNVNSMLGGWVGIVDATPDNNPLLGSLGGVEGLWIAAGLTGFGVMHGLAVGEAIAALAIGNEPDIDVHSYGIERFPSDYEFIVEPTRLHPFGVGGDEDPTAPTARTR